jgi:hypothetical protein
MRSIQKKIASIALVGGLAVFGAACEAETDVEDPAQEVPADDGLGDDTGTTEDDGLTDDGTEDTGTETETETEGDS